MLTFNAGWRFHPPADGRFRNATIPREVLTAVDSLIGKVATQGSRWEMLEHFKGAFSRAAGQSSVRSSSEDWAESDLWSAMTAASENAPLFLEALYEACEALRRKGLSVPDATMINDVCEKHGIGYVLNPPMLVLRESTADAVTSPIATSGHASITESGCEMLERSLERSERLLAEGRYREAVQETLWVLESVTTTFRGLEAEGDAVRGNYFNEIVRDLRRLSKGSTLQRVLEWVNSIHGFLSSPTGGGIRHGLDLTDGIPIGQGEARLFCNLIRSFTGYLLHEHDRLRHLND